MLFQTLFYLNTIYARHDLEKKTTTSMQTLSRPPRQCPQREYDIKVPSPPVQKPGLEFSPGGPPKVFKKHHDGIFNKEIGTPKVLILSTSVRSDRARLSPDA
jgi:hypothetical protein